MSESYFEEGGEEVDPAEDYVTHEIPIGNMESILWGAGQTLYLEKPEGHQHALAEALLAAAIIQARQLRVAGRIEAISFHDLMSTHEVRKELVEYWKDLVKSALQSGSKEQPLNPVEEEEGRLYDAYDSAAESLVNIRQWPGVIPQQNSEE